MSSDDSKIVNYLVRMVIPLRREFGQHLDVQHFLHDLDYAQEVIKKALGSQDARLREQADYVSKLRFGPRVGEAQTSATAPAAATAAGTNPALGSVERRKSPREATTSSAPAAATQAPAAPLSAEEEMKARIMKKYTSGLR